MQVVLKEGSPGGISLLYCVADMGVEVKLLIKHDPEVLSLFYKVKVCAMDVVGHVDDVSGQLSGDAEQLALVGSKFHSPIALPFL